MTTILGIDPGLATTGFGLIKADKKGLQMLKYGCLTTPAHEKIPTRLLTVAKDLNKIIKLYKPEIVSCEELFFAANSKTAIAVGQARGVALLKFAEHHLPVYEFTPLEVKLALTGYGRADKNQMQQMVKLLLNLENIPKPDDAADALAIAVCLAHSLSLVKMHA
ncbi:MAG: crossover junction endodeoxyribonuclease RuvC [bacterium]